jgi:hypothetical protein
MKCSKCGHDELVELDNDGTFFDDDLNPEGDD